MAANRRANVQVLRRLAGKHGVARVADDANRDKVKKMAKAVLEAVEKAGVDQEEANNAWKGFKGTWPDWTDGSTGSESDEEDEVSEKDDQASSPKKLVWFFSAAQFTYNGTTGDWASKDTVVLEALFARFKAFLLTCLAPFVPKGISATMERSTRTDEHVHLHCYFHLSKPFRAQGQNALQSWCSVCVALGGITNVKVVVWPQPNAHLCVRCDPFVLDHKCESGGLASAKCTLL